MHARHSNGFTLIELMVVVVIVAVLAVMAAPSYRDMIDRYRLRAAADEVVSLASNARVNAVKLDRDVTVRFGSSSDGWCMGAMAAAPASGGNPAGVGASDCDCVDSSPACIVDGETLLIPVGRHKGVGLIDATKTFVFDGNLGLVVPLASHDIDLTSPSRTYTARVRVRPLGPASICVPINEPSMAGVPSC